jgi:hypothetical protein
LLQQQFCWLARGGDNIGEHRHHDTELILHVGTPCTSYSGLLDDFFDGYSYHPR